MLQYLLRDARPCSPKMAAMAGDYGGYGLRIMYSYAQHIRCIFRFVAYQTVETIHRYIAIYNFIPCRSSRHLDSLIVTLSARSFWIQLTLNSVASLQMQVYILEWMLSYRIHFHSTLYSRCISPTSIIPHYILVVYHPQPFHTVFSFYSLYSPTTISSRQLTHILINEMSANKLPKIKCLK